MIIHYFCSIFWASYLFIYSFFSQGYGAAISETLTWEQWEVVTEFFLIYIFEQTATWRDLCNEEDSDLNAMGYHDHVKVADSHIIISLQVTHMHLESDFMRVSQPRRISFYKPKFHITDGLPSTL